MMADRAARRVGLGELSLEVLGTDICGAFLETARRGVYEEAKVAALPADLRSHYLEPESEGRLAVAPAIRRLVTLRRHGLLEPPPAKRFDLVSCRNVLIYLRPGARRRALEGLASVLVPNGVLLVGHSESLRDVPELFVPKRRLALGIYRLAREDDRREASPSLGSVASKPATTSLKPASRSTSPVTPLLTAPPPVVTSQPRRTELLRLEGEYDLDRSPETLERLKRRLSEAIEAGRDVLIDADGAICLDEPTAKLVIRAARAVEAHGLWLRVAATRPPVRRWAERHRLPLQVHEETPEVRRT
jgi:SAM-dependent methyltransferase